MSNTPYNPADQVDVDVTPALTDRNRLTCAFRVILAIPHLLLVGGPIALAGSWIVGSEDRTRIEWGAGTGVLGAVAAGAAEHQVPVSASAIMAVRRFIRDPP